MNLNETVSRIAQREINNMVSLLEAKKKKKKSKSDKTKRDKEYKKYKEKKKFDSAYNPHGGNPNISKTQERGIRAKLDTPGVDLAQIADDMWPHLKPKSKQSKLRKMVKGEKTSNGKYEYHFRKKDLDQLQKSKTYRQLGDRF